MKGLGTFLVQRHVISEHQRCAVQDQACSAGICLSIALVDGGLVDEPDLRRHLAEFFAVPAVDLDDCVPEQLLQLVPRQLAEKHCCLPINRVSQPGRGTTRSALIVAMANPHDVDAMNDLRFVTGCDIEAVVALEHQIAKHIAKCYDPSRHDTPPRAPTEKEIQQDLTGHVPHPYQLLLQENLVTASQLRSALTKSRATGAPLGQCLVAGGHIHENELLHFLSRQFGVPAVRVDEFDLDPVVVALVPSDLVRRLRCVPVSTDGTNLLVAMANPSDLTAIDLVAFESKMHVEVAVASATAVEQALARWLTTSKQDRTLGLVRPPGRQE